MVTNRKYANNMTPSNLIHPGEMIKDEIMARGITQKKLAQQMGVSYTVFNEILLSSGMRHPKYFLRSKSGLIARCSSVRNRV